jgi:hypothetical protein
MLGDSVIRQLKIDHGWTREFAERIYPFYLATLTNLSRGRPSCVLRVVDDMWHAHILCTRDYAAFCAREFGSFVHHQRFEDDVEVGGDPNGEDFFQDYGLSRADLLAICKDRPEYLRPDGGDTANVSSMHIGRCGAPGPCGDEAPQASSMQAPREEDAQQACSMQIAKCTAPELARLESARCGPPKPSDANLAHGLSRAAPDTGPAEFAVARCGSDEPPKPLLPAHGLAREIPGAAPAANVRILRAASCGAPNQTTRE